MANVKQESVESDCEGISDAWLAYWSNDKKIKKEEEEVNEFSVKDELEDSDNDKENDNLDIISVNSGSKKSLCRARSAKRSCRRREAKSENSNDLTLFEKELKNAPLTNKVENLCKYQCQICNNIFIERSSMSRHFKKTNHALVTQGSLNNYLIKIVAHNCHLCSKRILCDKITIISHLKNAHKMSLKEYAAKTGAIYKDEKNMKFATKIRLTDKNQKINVKSKTEPTISIADALKHSEVSENVKNLCYYQCPQCKVGYENRRSLQGHIRTSGHAILSRGEKVYKFLVHVVAHMCHICSKKILCDKIEISNHVKHKHKISSLKQYCDMSSIQYEKTEYVITKTQIGNLLHQNEDLETRITLKDALEQVAVSEKIENLCHYQCKKCKRLYKAKKSLKDHFKKTSHALTSEKSANTHLIKIIAHKCLVCSKKILCDKQDIYQHIQTHKIVSLKAYSNKTNAVYENKMERLEQDFEKFYSRNSAKQIVLKEIGNLCQFLCKSCPYTCKRWALMTKHITKENHGPILSPTEYATSVAFHKCYVCGDNQLLIQHARKHKLNLTAYRNLAKVPKTSLEITIRNRE